MLFRRFITAPSLALLMLSFQLQYLIFLSPPARPLACYVDTIEVLARNKSLCDAVYNFGDCLCSRARGRTRTELLPEAASGCLMMCQQRLRVKQSGRESWVCRVEKPSHLNLHQRCNLLDAVASVTPRAVCINAERFAKDIELPAPVAVVWTIKGLFVVTVTESAPQPRH